MKDKQSAFELAKILAVVGGLLTVVSGVLVLLSPLERKNPPGLEALLDLAVSGLLGVALGLVAIVGSRQVKNLVWSVVIIVVGVLAYRFDGGFLWSLGPVLVIVAGIAGVAARLV